MEAQCMGIKGMDVANKINEYCLIYSCAEDMYKNPKEYTKHFKDKVFKYAMDELKIGAYIKSEGYSAEMLYYQMELKKIDFSIWTSESNSTDSKYDFERHCWTFELILEHENHYKLWLDELQKCIITKAKNKIIVCYGRTEWNDNKIKAEEIMKFYKSQNMLSSSEGYIIMLGA